jgi:hypothetical protein
MLRNPLEVMQAEHGERILCGTESIVDFASALAADGQDETGAGPLKHRPRGMRYREIVRFAPQVARYFETFGRENVHVIIYEDFKGDTAKTYRETLSFLGLRTGFEPRFTRVNPNRRIRSMRLHRMVLAPPTAVRAISHAIMPQRIRRLVVDCVLRLNWSLEPRPPLVETTSQQLVVKLKREIEPDVDTLGRLLNRDLSGWYR